MGLFIQCKVPLLCVIIKGYYKLLAENSLIMGEPPLIFSFIQSLYQLFHKVALLMGLL